MRAKTAYLILVPLCLLAAWEAVARSGIAGLTVPLPISVAHIYLEPRFASLLWRSSVSTGRSALMGLILGALMGVATALISHLIPSLQPGLDRLAVTVNAIPVIALGPIFILLISRDLTPMLLATIAVYFLIYVAVSSGLRNALPELTSMMTTFGAGKWQRLRYLEIPAAIPSFLGGVKISMTAAMIGALVGEWFGAPTGLGIVILNTMQNFQVPLMWAAVLLASGLALAGYGIARIAERAVDRRFS